MKGIYFYILIFVVAGFSCNKKKYPESKVENDPIFYFKASVNNRPVSISAGPNRYYMYSSYGMDSNNVYHFNADLKQINCSNCTNRLQIRINDSKTSILNGTSYIDSLSARSYPYATEPVSQYVLQFQSYYNKTAASYLWDFGDGTASTLANPTHTYAAKGNYNICLGIKGTNGCVNNLCNVYKVGETNSSRTFIQATSLNNSINFAPSTSGQPPVSYLWDFGDGVESRAQFPSHTYTTPGSYPVRLKVTDANNQSKLINYNALTQNDLSACAANYRVVSENPVTALHLNLSAITVIWADEYGVTYRSDGDVQPASSSFQILSIEDYSNNENNQRTKKLHVKFTCRVYHGTDFLLLDNAEAVVCIAYN